MNQILHTWNKHNIVIKLTLIENTNKIKKTNEK